MIDINLFGKKQKAEPEITPIETTPDLPVKPERAVKPGRTFGLKRIFLFVIAVVIVLSVWRYKDILQYGKDIVDYVKTLNEEQPETEQPPPVEQPTTKETEPADEPAATSAWWTRTAR